MRSKKLEYDRQGLAVRLQEAMDDRDISRGELAVRSGYSLTSINRVLSGGDISLDLLVTLCEILNLTSDYALGYWEGDHAEKRSTH